MVSPAWYNLTLIKNKYLTLNGTLGGVPLSTTDPKKNKPTNAPSDKKGWVNWNGKLNSTEKSNTGKSNSFVPPGKSNIFVPPGKSNSTENLNMNEKSNSTENFNINEKSNITGEKLDSNIKSNVPETFNSTEKSVSAGDIRGYSNMTATS